MHGKKQSTEFNIKNIEEMGSGVRCTVLIEHDQQQEFTLFKEEFIEMVIDPLPGIGGTIKQTVERVWIPFETHCIGGKPPRLETKKICMAVREVACWCCDRKLRVYEKATPSQDSSSASAIELVPSILGE